MFPFLGGFSDQLCPKLCPVTSPSFILFIALIKSEIILAFYLFVCPSPPTGIKLDLFTAVFCVSAVVSGPHGPEVLTKLTCQGGGNMRRLFRRLTCEREEGAKESEDFGLGN